MSECVSMQADGQARLYPHAQAVIKISKNHNTQNLHHATCRLKIVIFKAQTLDF